MTNYGSNIKFDEERTGTVKGKDYEYVASANIQYTDTIFLNKHESWKRPLKDVIKQTIMVIPHESIHGWLWDNGYDDKRGYDIVRNKLLTNCSRRRSRIMFDIYFSGC